MPRERLAWACRQGIIVWAVAIIMMTLVLARAALLGRGGGLARVRDSKPPAEITTKHTGVGQGHAHPGEGERERERERETTTPFPRLGRVNLTHSEPTASSKAPSSRAAAHDIARTLARAPASSSSRAADPSAHVLSRAASSTSTAFDKIYRDKYWTNGRESESISGPGSTRRDTEKGRVCIAAWLEKYGIVSLGDICGDFNWQHMIRGINESNYIGLDTSELALERARRDHPGWRLERLDLVDNVPPPTDAFMVREVLQHLPLKLGAKLVQNVIRSGARFLIVSTFPGNINKDIRTGQYYMNDVAREPFASVLVAASGAHRGGGHRNLRPLETCRLYSTRKHGELWLLDLRASGASPASASSAAVTAMPVQAPISAHSEPTASSKTPSSRGAAARAIAHVSASPPAVAAMWQQEADGEAAMWQQQAA